jgi:hypothetical protein
MRRDLRQRRCAICGSDFLLLYFQACGTAQYLTPFFHSGYYSHFISASVIAAICIALSQRDKNRYAPLRAAELRSYWKQVFYDYFHNFIAQLRATRKLLLENQLKPKQKLM